MQTVVESRHLDIAPFLADARADNAAAQRRAAAEGPADAVPVPGLRQLVLMRNLCVAGLILALIVVERFFALPVSGAALGSIIVFLLLFNMAAVWHMQRSGKAGDGEVLVQILVDVGALSVFFYLSGGATNPFVDLYLVPLAVAALRLQWRQTAYVGALTLACYLLLVKLHVPLPAPRDGATGFLCVGMWVKFLLCGGFIAYVLRTLSGRLRERERSLADARQRIVTEDYLVRVGTLAAGAAHEIGSPLCTMAVLVNEMRVSHADRPDLTKQLRLMAEQIDASRDILAQLVKYGQDVLVDGTRTVPVDAFLHDVVGRWRTLRPGATLACRRSGPQPAPAIRADVGLGHALLNLMNNAADASSGTVEMDCSWTQSELRLRVLDRGPGIPVELAHVLGQRFFTTKRDKGSGIGLLVAHSAVQRAGGSLKLENRPGGGACAELVVPLERAISAMAVPAPAPEVHYFQIPATDH